MRLKFKKVENFFEKNLILKLNNNFINPQLNSLLNSEEIEILWQDLKLKDLENDKYFFIKKWRKIIWFWSFREKTEKIFYLSGFYILPKYQRNWFWKKSLKMIIKYFQKRKIDYLYLETYKKFIHAISFYENFWLNSLKLKDFENSFLSKIYKKISSESFIFYKEFFPYPKSLSHR